MSIDFRSCGDPACRICGEHIVETHPTNLDIEITRERLYAIRICEWILFERLKDSSAERALEEINRFGNDHQRKLTALTEAALGR